MAVTIAVYSTHPWMEEGGQIHELRYVDAIPRVIVTFYVAWNKNHHCSSVHGLKPAPLHPAYSEWIHAKNYLDLDP